METRLAMSRPGGERPKYWTDRAERASCGRGTRSPFSESKHPRVHSVDQSFGHSATFHAHDNSGIDPGSLDRAVRRDVLGSTGDCQTGPDPKGGAKQFVPSPDPLKEDGKIGFLLRLGRFRL